MCLQAGLRILMQRHALGSATLEDVLTALVDGVAAVSDSNDDTGMLPEQLTLDPCLLAHNLNGDVVMKSIGKCLIQPFT